MVNFCRKIGVYAVVGSGVQVEDRRTWMLSIRSPYQYSQAPTTSTKTAVKMQHHFEIYLNVQREQEGIVLSLDIQPHPKTLLHFHKHTQPQHCH